jgi:hypothetical protein
VRIASVFAFAFNAILWGSLTSQLLMFAVAHFGRLPVITPPWLYGALIFFCAVIVAPPGLAVLIGRPLRRPGVATAGLLAAVVVAVAAAWLAPAYSQERPQRRYARFVHDTSTGQSFWQVAGSEPGLDLDSPPAGWGVAPGSLPVSIPLPGLRSPFVWQREASEVPPDVPARVTSGVVVAGNSAELTLSVTPAETGLAASFVLPDGVSPIRPNLPGVIRQGRWVARFAAIPPEGVAFRAFVRIEDVPRLGALRVVLTRSRLPGGSGWQGLPPWLPRQLAVWTTEAAYITLPLPEVAPLPGLAEP